MGRNQTLNYSHGGLLALPSPQSCCWRSHLRGGTDPPLPLRWDFGGAKEHEQSYVSPVLLREVQVSDHCKQINALKGTAENMVSNQQHLMSQDAVGSFHQEYIQEIRNMAVIK